MGQVFGPVPSFGKYTPSASNFTNCDSVTPAEVRWIRVGNNVLLFGRTAVDPTAAGSCIFRLSLPTGMTSNFASADDCRGVANGLAVAGVMSADTTNDLITISFTAIDGTSLNISFSGGFEII